MRLFNKQTESSVPIELKGIRLEDGSQWLHFEPKDDITNIELAHMIVLISAFGKGAYDFPRYIRDHKLDRHFTAKNKRKI